MTASINIYSYKRSNTIFLLEYLKITKFMEFLENIE